MTDEIKYVVLVSASLRFFREFKFLSQLDGYFSNVSDSLYVDIPPVDLSPSL